MVWYSHLFKNFPHFLVIHTVKGFSIVNEAEVDTFMVFPCFFYDPTYVGNLIPLPFLNLPCTSASSWFIKKIRDIKKIFHARMGTMKDRNLLLGIDLTEAEEIKKRWQGYTELYKKGLNELDNHNGVISHLGQTSWVVKSSGP